MSYAQATFAAGCFWGVEYRFSQIPGVIATCVGYMGGHTLNPTYPEVCSDQTGHAEVVQVTYAPEQVSYEKLLEVFWKCHDPTLLNRQGPDVGTQYRSAIFYYDSTQKELAEQSKQALSAAHQYKDPIVTEIAPATEFYPAEEYHQQYVKKHGGESCEI